MVCRPGCQLPMQAIQKMMCEVPIMLIKIDHDFLNKLTDTEKNVISFINWNAEKISNMSISDVAEAS